MNREELFARNLEAARDFIHELIDNPEQIDAIEDGATIVLFPADDPALCKANRAMVERGIAEGARVIETPRGRTPPPKSETA